MGFFEIFLIGVGLSMDAFAVSICKGLKMKKINYGQAVVIALFFGVFQAGMPMIGWFLGSRFLDIIASYDHWIAFGLLVIIGGNMIREAFSPEEKNDDCTDVFDIKELFFMAIATSIDALAVGVAFATLGDSLNIFGIGAAISIWLSFAIIGVTTFVISVAGVKIGNVFGTKYKSKAEVAGGIILIVIGIKILLEHIL